MSKIPAFPGFTDKKLKPLPPKYLEITNADGTTRTVENPKRAEAEAARGGSSNINKPKQEAQALINPAAPKHLHIVQKGGPTPFVKTNLAQTAPIKTYDAVPHRFKAAVDSRSEAKGMVGNTMKLHEQLMDADYSHIQNTHSGGPRYKGSGLGMTGFGGVPIGGSDALLDDGDSVGMGSVGDYAHAQARAQAYAATSAPRASSSKQQLPTEFGTSYKDIPNSHVRQNFVAPPKAALPRPYVPHAKHFFEGQAKLANRTTSGEILGSYTRNYVDKANLPYTEPGFVAQAAAVSAQAAVAVQVGPDNPIQPYDAAGIWSACWDEEASAIYYYNNSNGEATWIPPEV